MFSSPSSKRRAAASCSPGKHRRNGGAPPQAAGQPPTAELAQTFVDLGFKAIVTCVDSKILSKTFVGRMIDDSFLAELPPNVDPCGENGEFHSFVLDGPIFKRRISLEMEKGIEG